jgi:hypothetical protein
MSSDWVITSVPLGFVFAGFVCLLLGATGYVPILGWAAWPLFGLGVLTFVIEKRSQ